MTIANHGPKITSEAGTSWAVAAFTGTLYETQISVMKFLSSNQVKNPAGAKIATDTFQNVHYTFVVFEN